MTRTLMLGNLPLIKNGPNKNRLDRKSTAKVFGFSSKQIYKAYNNWIQTFRYKDSNLSFEEYLYKIKEASISPDQIGNKPNQYNLARHNDEGSYTKDNCRFITAVENLAEEKRESVFSRSVKKHGKEITIKFLSNNGKKGARVTNSDRKCKTRLGQ